MEREKLRDEECEVRSNEAVAPGLYLMQLSSPKIAAALQPGQFVHMKLPGMQDHILRRPFSVYRTEPASGVLDILYQVVGYGTNHMTQLVAGSKASLIGPVGQGWHLPDSDCGVLLVGGGVGAAPLYMLGQQLAQAGRKLHVVLGAQTRAALATYDDYLSLPGVSVAPATDDGSFGHAGFCTQPAQEAIDSGDYGFVACCGPEPLMRIVSAMAIQAGIECQVSMERRMACGVGACLSCVVETDEGKKRACVDGPVFDARKVVW